MLKVFKLPNPEIEKLQSYLNDNLLNGPFKTLPKGATNIRVYKSSQLRGTVNSPCFVSATYYYKGKRSKIEFFLKFYEGESDSQMKCLHAYRVLKALEMANFPVPHVYSVEDSGGVLGTPFTIMEKVEGKTLKDYIKHLNKQETLSVIRRFAQTLVFLHELNPDKMKLDFLTVPKGKYEYAKKQKNDLPVYVKKRDVYWATSYLERNALKVPCNKYSLLHCDMNPKNFLVDATGKIIVTDWEWAEIGDPLKDVGYAYHSIAHIFGARSINRKGIPLANYFLKQYANFSKTKINPLSLRFYIISAGLRELIYFRYLSNQLINPFSANKLFGKKSFLLFPLFSLHFRRRAKHLERFLRRAITNYEELMFGTIGGKILSALEKEDILRLLSAKSSDLILDIGTASGRVAREIVSKSKSNVVGIDIWRSGIKSAKIRSNKFIKVIAHGQYLPFKANSFDAIICIRALKYFPNPIQGVSEMVRVLKPNKKLVVDLSSPLGYEIILRHTTQTLSARGSHVFNFYKMKNLLESKGLIVVESVPLQKIPHKVWDLSTNLTVLHTLLISENILKRLPPLVLCRSVLLKCVNQKARAQKVCSLTLKRQNQFQCK